MNLRNRLMRLEAQTGGLDVARPDVILMVAVEADGSQTVTAALLLGVGVTIIREPDETEDAFTMRAHSLAGPSDDRKRFLTKAA